MLIMKTLVRFCALAWLASSPLTVTAATLVTQYWPMNEGDIRFFSGVAGASYLEFIQDEFGDSSRFSMDIYSQERPGEDYEHYGKSTYGYSPSADTLINYGQRGPIGAYLHFQPPWALLTDSLLEKGGTKSSRFSAGVPSVTNVAVTAVVQVKSVGTITVPAGTFHDCRSVSFTIKLAARGGVVGGQAMILAPGAGLVRLGVANARGQFIGWQSLTGGTVGGVDVRELATRIPPTIVLQPRGKTVRPGARLRLFVRAKGPGPLAYQWYFNNGPIPDANQSAHVLPRVASENGGSYQVVVSNAGGSVTSSVATVTIR